MDSKRIRQGISTALGFAAAAGVLALLGAPAQATTPDNAPERLTLTGVVRDFDERHEFGGHPDFESRPSGGFGVTVGLVEDELGADGRPVLRGEGRRVQTAWRTAANETIHPEFFDPTRSDVPGAWGGADDGGIESAENFAMWFSDDHPAESQMEIALDLVRDAERERWVFDNRTDPAFRNEGGFFPINGRLLGDSSGADRNHHFTFETHAEFTHDRDTGGRIEVRSADDCWVFIDGRLVIDLGGVHSPARQSVEFNRLHWLEDGQTYRVDFFFADRHRAQASLRIETDVELRPLPGEPVFGSYEELDD